MYALFHLGAVLVAVVSHGFNKASWKFLWAVPFVYLLIAGFEALLAGSVTGLMSAATPIWKFYDSAD